MDGRSTSPAGSYLSSARMAKLRGSRRAVDGAQPLASHLRSCCAEKMAAVTSSSVNPITRSAANRASNRPGYADSGSRGRRICAAGEVPDAEVTGPSVHWQTEHSACRRASPASGESQDRGTVAWSAIKALTSGALRENSSCRLGLCAGRRTGGRHERAEAIAWPAERWRVRSSGSDRRTLPTRTREMSPKRWRRFARAMCESDREGRRNRTIVAHGTRSCGDG